MSETWQPANDGAGSRKWFLARERPDGTDYHDDRRGRLVRYGSYEAARTAADQLNRVVDAPEIQPGDRVMVRNDLGGYICDDYHGEPIERTVREVSPILGVRLSDGWYALDSVDRVGGMRTVRPEPDAESRHQDSVRAERAAWAVATHQAVREGFEILRGAR